MGYDNISFDMSALREYLENNALNKMLFSLPTEDKSSRDTMIRFILAANKHGVSTETIMKIAIEATTGVDGEELCFDDFKF